MPFCSSTRSKSYRLYLLVTHNKQKSGRVMELWKLEEIRASGRAEANSSEYSPKMLPQCNISSFDCKRVLGLAKIFTVKVLARGSHIFQNRRK